MARPNSVTSSYTSHISQVTLNSHPILVLTGKDSERDVRKAGIHKIDGFIVKPPTAETLGRYMRKALGL